MFAWEGSQLFEAEGILVSYSLSSLRNLCFKVICVFDLNWMMHKPVFLQPQNMGNIPHNLQCGKPSML